MTDSVAVIVPAAGAGKRLGLGHNKAFVSIGGVPLLVLCLQNLAAIPVVQDVIVVAAPAETEEVTCLLEQHGPDRFPGLAWQVTAGGKERQDSVARGLACVDSGVRYVAVHDGARPFISETVFMRTLDKAKKYDAAIAAVPVKDTVKLTDAAGMVKETLPRVFLRAVQTPQIFTLELLRRAYAFATEHLLTVTDDASLIEALGRPVAVAEGDYRNIKVTTPEDLLLAEQIAAQWQR